MLTLLWGSWLASCSHYHDYCYYSNWTFSASTCSVLKESCEEGCMKKQITVFVWYGCSAVIKETHSPGSAGSWPLTSPRRAAYFPAEGFIIKRNIITLTVRKWLPSWLWPNMGRFSASLFLNKQQWERKVWIYWTFWTFLNWSESCCLSMHMSFSEICLNINIYMWKHTFSICFLQKKRLVWLFRLEDWLGVPVPYPLVSILHWLMSFL